MVALPVARTGGAKSALLGIGQVLTKLNQEFPELTPSKLRFLEVQGLVNPARTATGYRKFSQDDIDRLRLILTMQRDHYLPLKVIGAYLADRDAGLQPPFPGAGPDAPSMLPLRVVLTRETLLSETGASAALLDDAVRLKLIPATELYREEHRNVLEALVALSDRGIEPRHLRPVQVAVDREVDLLTSALAQTVHARDGVRQAEFVDQAADLANHLDVIRATLRRAALARAVQR